MVAYPNGHHRLSTGLGSATKSQVSKRVMCRATSWGQRSASSMGRVKSGTLFDWYRFTAIG